MRKQSSIVKLGSKERDRLESLTRKGKSPAQLQKRAHILLQADTSKRGAAQNDAHIALALGCCEALCGRTRKRYVEQGLEAVLTRKKRQTPPVPCLFDGEKEARLIQLACSAPPPGQAGWSLRLLANKVVELHIVDHAGRNTIGTVLKKTCLSPTSRNSGSSRRKPTLRS